jgi:hypothetical protein
LTGEAKFSVKEESDSSRTIDDEDSIFETRGKADCLLIASGKTFLCHKAILAHRSMELRNMIMMEFTTNENYFNLPVQILLPELQKDSARAFLYFLYRDFLPSWIVGNSVLLNSLSRIGKILRIPRLQLLCEHFINLLSYKILQINRENQVESDLPPLTLVI